MARREGLQSREGVGMDIIGPQSSDATRRMVGFRPRRNRLPATWMDTSRAENIAAVALIEGLRDDELPLVRLPGGPELRNPTPGEVSRALGVGLEAAPREEVDLVVVGGGPAGLGAAVYGACEGLDALRRRGQRARRPGGHVAPDRELPGLPGGRPQRLTAHGQGDHAGAEVRRPYRDALPRDRGSSQAPTATSSGSRMDMR